MTLVKRAPDAIVVAVDFGTTPTGASAINAGETVVPSNARGSLAVVATDRAGNDASATILEGDPWIVADTRVAFWILGGVAGQAFHLEVIAPTSDGELLSDRVRLEIST